MRRETILLAVCLQPCKCIADEAEISSSLEPRGQLHVNHLEVSDTHSLNVNTNNS